MTEAQLQHNWSASTYGGMSPSSAVSAVGSSFLLVRQNMLPCEPLCSLGC